MLSRDEKTAEALADVRRALRPVKRVYAAIMQNTLLRSRLASSSLESGTWREVEWLVEQSREGEDDRDRPSAGASVEREIERFYSAFRAALHFRTVLADEIRPVLKSELSRPRSSASRENRLLLEMTANNIDENIELLVRGLSVVFEAVRRLDTVVYGRPHVL
jgi:hypothetical protein